MSSVVRGLVDDQTITIASGQTTSDTVVATGTVIAGVIIPAAMTGTAFTFTVCNKRGGAFVPLRDEYGVVVTLPITVNAALNLPAAIATWPYFKFVSGSSEGADRILRVVCKG